MDDVGRLPGLPGMTPLFTEMGIRFGFAKDAKSYNAMQADILSKLNSGGSCALDAMHSRLGEKECEARLADIADVLSRGSAESGIPLGADWQQSGRALSAHWRELYSQPGASASNQLKFLVRWVGKNCALAPKAWSKLNDKTHRDALARAHLMLLMLTLGAHGAPGKAERDYGKVLRDMLLELIPLCPAYTGHEGTRSALDRLRAADTFDAVPKDFTWLLWVLLFYSRTQGDPSADRPSIRERQMFFRLCRYHKWLSERNSAINDDLVPISLGGHTALHEHYIPVNLTDAGFEASRYYETDDDRSRGLFERMAEKDAPRLAVIGSASYGKTTMLRAVIQHSLSQTDDWMYLRGETEQTEPIERLERRQKPFYIDCSEINVLTECTFEDYMRQSLADYSDCEDINHDNLLELTVSGENSLAEHGELLLLIDGLDKLNADKISGSAAAALCFFATLEHFLERYPDIGCIITGTRNSFAPLGELKGYSVCWLERFRRHKVAAYCRRWFALLAGERGRREGGSADRPLGSSVAGRLAKLAQEVSDTIVSTDSLRRQMRRPLFLYYLLSEMGDSESVNIPKTPFQFMRMIVDSAIARMEALLRADGGGEVEDGDLRMPLAYISMRMFRYNDYQITIPQLEAILRDAAVALDPYLSDGCCLRGEKGAQEYIRTRLERKGMYLVRFSGKGADRRFAFSSRPIRWYFACRALCDGGLDAAWSADSTLRFIKEQMYERCTAPEHSDYIDDWVELIVWTVAGLERAGEPVIRYLIECTRLSTVANRCVRVAAVRMLARILAQRPPIGRELREQACQAAFVRYLYRQQREDIHNLISSSRRDSFVGFALGRLRATLDQPFPEYIWLVTYIDWLELTDNSFSAYPSPEDSLRGVILTKAQREERHPDKASRIDPIIRYIDRELNQSKGEAQYKEQFIRAVGALLVFFWLKVYDRGKENAALRSDTNLLEGSLTRPIACLRRLVKQNGSCAANIACYALTHLLNDGALKVDPMSADGQELILDALRADYAARALKLNAESDEPYHVTHPLCGGLRFITSLPVTAEMLGMFDVERAARKLYRERWEYYINDDVRKPISDREKRYAMLLFKPCLLVGAFRRSEIPECVRRIRQASRDAGRFFSLEYDNEEEYMAQLTAISERVSSEMIDRFISDDSPVTE